MESTTQNKLKVNYVLLEDLKPNPKNARIHSKKQIRMIAESIKIFGFVCPVLVDRNNQIVAGHARSEAAKIQKLKCIPTIRLENLSPAQLRAYMIAENRLAEHSTWDYEILAVELKELIELDLDLDVTVTGFEVPEIDQLIAESARSPDSEDDLSAEEHGPPVTKLGDLWIMGKHRLFCGSALDDDSYETLMGTNRASAIFADPPYNVRINGHVGGNGTIHHREFPDGSSGMSESEFISFLSTGFELWCRYSAVGSVHYVCMDWRHLHEILNGLGSFYRSQHELVLVYRNGKNRHRNNVQLGKFGRNRSNVWAYPGIRTQSRQSDEGNLLKLHPTIKPIAMVADAVLDCTKRNEIVLDAFLGSGTTLLAAERTGRICYGIELDPLYVDTAILRWQRHTGDHAIHVASGKRFDDIANECLEVAHG